MSEIDDDDLDNLLEDDPESQYHPPDEIKSVEAMKLEIKMCQIFIKQGKLDQEEAKIKLDTLKSMIDLAEASKRNTPDQYIDSVKDAWSSHQEWLEACKEDDSLGSDKKSHTVRIK